MQWLRDHERGLWWVGLIGLMVWQWADGGGTCMDTGTAFYVLAGIAIFLQIVLLTAIVWIRKLAR